MTPEDKYKNLDRINFWITNCDTKASYLLALEGIVLTVIFTSNYSTCIITTLSYKFSFENFGWSSFFRFVEGLSLYSFFCLTFISLVNIYKTVKARLNPKIFREEGLETNSLLFFETIANRKFQTFILETKNITAEQLENDLDSQIFINSKICQQKFKHYNLTVKYAVWAFLSGLLYLIFAVDNCT
jgi:hypothetical protein